MEEKLLASIAEYTEKHKGDYENLLKELGQIPAPTRHEEKRAEFIRKWLIQQGASKVYIDNAKNVICELDTDVYENVTVFMAHTDIVFPDTDPLKLIQDGRILRAPGIGDDTSNLVNLLMGVKYLLTYKVELQTGFVIVANSCEEGLGNLDGCKEIIRNFGKRITAFYSFDGYLGQCTSDAVGSYRYKISVKTIGGHSYLNFGNPNAIVALSELIRRLYSIRVPGGEKTTYNVGRIEGGTTVNTIAEDAYLLYEFRSTSQKNLDYMKEALERTVDSMKEEYSLNVEVLGIRPGRGEFPEGVLEKYTEDNAEIIKTFYDGDLDFQPFSTDSNVPLSVGILANTIGTVAGGRAHTREEWIDLDSLQIGSKIVLSCMLKYVR